jgi:hypothetical protein
MTVLKRRFHKIIVPLFSVFFFTLIGCDTPAADPLPEGHPFIFTNESSVEIQIWPNPEHPGQGWSAFSLKSGESKTVYSLLNYYDLPDTYAIFFLHRQTGAATGQLGTPGEASYREGEEPGRITFNAGEQEPETGTVRVLNGSNYNITYFKLVYTDGFSGWEYTPPSGIPWAYNTMSQRNIRPGEFYLRIRDSSGKEITSTTFTLDRGETLDLVYDGNFVTEIESVYNVDTL